MQRDVLGASDLPRKEGQSPLVFATEEHSADLEQNVRAQPGAGEPPIVVYAFETPDRDPRPGALTGRRIRGW